MANSCDRDMDGPRREVQPVSSGSKGDSKSAAPVDISKLPLVPEPRDGKVARRFG